MSKFLRTLAEGSDFISDSKAPVNLDGAHLVPVHGLLAQKIEAVERFARDPPFQLTDLSALTDAVKHINTGINDRDLLLEKVLVFMSRLGDTPISAKVQQFVIDLLYKDLPHPPSSYLSALASGSPLPIISTPNVKYAFRSADGSNYNPLFPSLGKARSPYARSVPSANFTPLSALPDAGLVFDTLLCRKKFVPHPGGISSLFFAFANLVIHSIFNTNYADWTINDTSSYLDLSILYGSSQDQIDQVRRKELGTGSLWEDTFADSRLLHMPPSTCALLVLLNRNHNYIAQKILNINERGNYSDPLSIDAAKRLAQDDEIFHRARLVNSGFFMQIILGDYVGAILGLARDGYDWRLDPLMTMRQTNHEFSPRGEGNAVSIEFNLLYRWHSTLSEHDAKWTEDAFQEIFKPKDLNKVTPDDFKEAAHIHMKAPEDVRTWTFGGLTRSEGRFGRFSDSELANILQNATEWSAGAFQARGSPQVLRVIEILGIEQARSWGTCSLNEFRKFMGLKAYSSFKEWNPDSEIHTAAAALYKDIENLELHVGMQAEEAKKPGPGAGLCPGYTISRAILADAVSLTRGDRYLTVEFTPFNLTSWGFQDCQFDKADGSYGGMLTKLLFRTLPDRYPAGSTFAHFPFLVPDAIKKCMEKHPVNRLDKYTWMRPPVPKGFVTVDTYDGVSQVTTEKSKFMSGYDNRLSNITTPAVLERSLVNNILVSENKRSAEFFVKTTKELIAGRSVDHVGSTAKYVDIVKDVINVLPVRYISGMLAGLPVKNEANPGGTIYEQRLYEMFADVCRYVYLNFDPVNDWKLRESSADTFKTVIKYVSAHLDNISGISISDAFFHTAMVNDHSHEFLKKLHAAGKGRGHNQLAASLFAEVVPTAAHFSQILSHVINFYLDEGRQEAREDIVRLASLHTEVADAEILSYSYEALRLDPPVSAVYRTAAVDTYVGSTKVEAGERVFASIVHANLDTNVFGSESTAAVYNRSEQKPVLLGIGEHGLLSAKFVESTVPQILGTILGLKKIQRDPGKSGRFNRFTEDLHGTRQQLYINSRGEVTPWPDSLVIQYDA